MQSIELAEFYYLELEDSDYDKLSNSELKLVINDDYTKSINLATGETILDVLGITDRKFTFKDGNDLNYQHSNIVFLDDKGGFPEPVQPVEVETKVEESIQPTVESEPTVEVPESVPTEDETPVEEPVTKVKKKIK